ncbi:MAG: DUF423 domain-containing protein [Flavobacteriales bacterium]|nr:DUF423 domain-containing protein [Flavobacteriales bacterium]MDG2086157.1 DUF423 domain-containing protein [Flavobacteriales bacterium]
MTTNNFIRISIFFALTAVIFGALGAHYLKDLITSSQLTSFKTGVKYQFFHALAILLISLNKDKFNTHVKKSLFFLFIGTLFFSFSIYLLALKDLLLISFQYLGLITPIGGLLLIIGWFLLFFCLKKKK